MNKNAATPAQTYHGMPNHCMVDEGPCAIVDVGKTAIPRFGNDEVDKLGPIAEAYCTVGVYAGVGIGPIAVSYC